MPHSMFNANLPIAEKRDRGCLLQTRPWKSPRQRSAAGTGGAPRVAVQITGTHPAARQGEETNMMTLETDRGKDVAASQFKLLYDLYRDHS